MADGATKPIEQVKVGDRVQSRDEATGQVAALRVTKAFELETTANHPFTVAAYHTYFVGRVEGGVWVHNTL
jgi:hypothetical protein